MSTTKELKEYLINEDDGFLLNDDNNGKTIMLSGAWGAGKTHFWLNDIKPILNKNQTNIYISLYGKESISELKFEVLKEAYNLEVKEDFISKSASMLSSIAPSLGEKSMVDGFDKLNKKAKDKKAEEILKSGSIICLDDFERKSKKIDLNDLFGYISQLALDYDCKVVIILNSDVFEGEEKNIFKTVKEKTINKFFNFEPTIEELFESIYKSDSKYKKMDDYKSIIMHAIMDSEELNARVYIQVLDNCLEWGESNYDNSVLNVLVLVTINFVLNNMVLSYRYNVEPPTINVIEKVKEILPNILESTLKFVNINSVDLGLSSEDVLRDALTKKSLAYEHIVSYHELQQYSDEVVYAMSKMDLVLNNNEEIILNVEDTYKILERYIIKNIDNNMYGETMVNEVKSNYLELFAIWKYGYRLYYMQDINEEIYIKISNFVKTGILPKQTKEVESSLPPEAIAKRKV